MHHVHEIQKKHIFWLLGKDTTVMQQTPDSRYLVKTLLAALACLHVASGLAQPAEPAHEEEGPASESSQSDPHAHHRQMMKESRRYTRSVAEYTMPAGLVTDDRNRQTPFDELVGSGRPVAITFVFTTCTTICPVLSAIFAQAQPALQAAEIPPLMISVSIDPEYDTPERLREYAEKFKAGENWVHITGSKQDIIDIQVAFDAYRGNKLSHEPLILLYPGSGKSWVRLEGFTSGKQLAEEYEEMMEGQDDEDAMEMHKADHASHES